MKFINEVKNISNYVSKNKRHILSGASIATSLWSAKEWYTAGIKAHDIIKDHKKDMDDCYDDDKEAKRAVIFETIKDIAPIVVKPVLITTATCGMIFANDRISSKEIAVLAAAYTMSEGNLERTREKVKEMFGETNARKMDGEMSKDKLRKDGPIKESNVIVTGNGDVLCKDFYSGRLFYSSVNTIEKIINQLSSDIRDDMYVSLNDFYNLIGLEPIPLGDDLGWNVDNCIRGQIPIHYNAVLTDDNRPCLCLEFDVHPRMDYRDLH